jgi:hypothetical protein
VVIPSRTILQDLIALLEQDLTVDMIVERYTGAKPIICSQAPASRTPNFGHPVQLKWAIPG